MAIQSRISCRSTLLYGLCTILTTGVSVWDVAGGNIIAEEAGAKVTDLNGNPWSWRNVPQNIVAANPALHQKILQKITKI